MTLPWPRRRSALNHDWLKNKLLQSLGKSLNIAAGEVEIDEPLTDYVSRLANDWRAHVDEALALVHDFPVEMSPRALAAGGTLPRLAADSREWLGETIHRMWLDRYAVEAWTEEADRRIRTADAACDRLRAVLEDPDDAVLRAALEEFHTACIRVADAVTHLPGEMLRI